MFLTTDRGGVIGMKSRSTLWSLIGMVASMLFIISACNRHESIGELTVDKTEFANVSSSGDTLKVLISAAEDFKLTPQDKWISTNMDEASGRTRITISVEPNFLNQERTGYLKVSTSDRESTITIHQLYGDADKDAYVYELPVIFHVLYNESEQQRLIDQDREGDEYPKFVPISSAQLQAILEKVNRIYRGDPELPTQTIERNNYEKDRGNYVNAHVKFVLATKDEGGNKLSPIGIKRYAIEEKELDPKVVMGDIEGGKYNSMAFPINQYINVFIFPFKSESATSMTLGIAHFPQLPSEYALEGLGTVDQSVAHYSNYNHCIALNSKMFEPMVVYGKNALYHGPDVVYYTLAHELGHALGLRHVFSESVGSDGVSIAMVDECIDSDYCEDTHTYNRIRYDRTRLPINTVSPYSSYEGLRRRTNCSGIAFTSTNIMDYEISWSDRLTKDQLKRLRHVLYYSFSIPGKPKLAKPRSLRSVGGVAAKPMTSSCPNHLH